MGERRGEGGEEREEGGKERGLLWSGRMGRKIGVE